MEVKDPQVERLVLRYLDGRALSRAELVTFTGATDHQVQAVLDELIGMSHIVRRPQDIGPADYELTPAGVERLAQIGKLTASPGTVTKRPPVAKKRQPPRRRTATPDLPARPTPFPTSRAGSAAPARTPRFEASPKAVDRELVVNLAKSLVVGVVFAGVLIVWNPSLLMMLVLLVVTAGNMFQTYRTWAKKRRPE